MKKILIIGPSWIGDMVMAQSLFKSLQDQFNNLKEPVTIDVLAPKWSQPILECMPEVNKAIIMPVGHGKLKLWQRYQLARTLRAENYTQALILPNSLKSALIPFWAKIPLRTGWRGEFRYFLLNDCRRLDKNKYKLMVERYLALGSAKTQKNVHQNSHYQAYYPKLVTSDEAIQAVLEKFAITIKKQPLLILCPGAAYGPSKRWPEKYFAAVAEYYLKKNWTVGLLGGPAEKITVQCVNQLLKNPAIDLTSTSLAEAVSILSVANTVVSNDSGMMHVACAVSDTNRYKTKASFVLGIYGSTTPEFTPPLSQHAQTLSKQLPCKPCFKRECPLGNRKPVETSNVDTKTIEPLSCLTQIRPTAVIELINKKIGN